MATEVYLQALLGLPYVPTAAAVSPPLGRLPLKPLKKMKLVLTATSPRLGFLANECYPLRRGGSQWASQPNPYIGSKTKTQKNPKKLSGCG